MANWLKVDAALDDHPKIIAAGFWGSSITQALWRLAKLFDSPRGDVTRFANPAYLARRLQISTKQAALGLNHASLAGLLEETEEGVFIHDWEEEQEESYQARQRRLARERKRKQRAKDRDDRDPSRESQTVTKSRGDRKEKKREEETEKKPQTKKTTGRPKREVPQWAIESASLIMVSILRVKPDHRISRMKKPKVEALLKAWAVHLERLHRLDGISTARITAALVGLPRHTFWSKNIQSGETFRRQFDRLEQALRDDLHLSPPSPSGGPGGQGGGGPSEEDKRQTDELAAQFGITVVREDPPEERN